MYQDNNGNDNYNDEYSHNHILPEENEKEYEIESSGYYREEPRTYEYKEEKKKKNGFRGSLMSYIALALIASLIGGFAAPMVSSLYALDSGKPSAYTQATPISINTNDSVNTIAAVAKKGLSSVVGITTIEQVQQYFYGTQQVEGVGSGIIVHEDGLILTNSHVVGSQNEKSVTVLFENGDKVPATILWNDSTIDLAIIKVNVTNLPVAELGDSDEIEVGEIAVAIGNPLGLEFQRTVTAGIISGLHRSVQVSSSSMMEDLIQTDASINSGNSGGPLLNSRGQVIGINTAKIKTAEGLGFAIPINEAKVAIDQVIDNGSFQTVFMGISGISVEEYENTLGIKLSVDKGLVLLQVSPNTPAHNAGLYNGDIIKSMDGVEIDSLAKLKKTLLKYKLGDKAKLVVVRTNEELNLEIEFTQTR